MRAPAFEIGKKCGVFVATFLVFVALLGGAWLVAVQGSVQALPQWIGLTLFALPFSSFFKRRRDPREEE
jgi:hypothetical protein